MVPRGAGCMLASILTGLLTTRFGEKTMIIAGLIILSIGGLLFGEINTHIALANIAIPNFLFGLGMVMAMVPMISLSCSTLHNEQQTNAAGVQNLLKNIGAAIGTSISTTMISRFSQAHQHMMVEHLNFDNPAYMSKLDSLSGTFGSLVDSNTAEYMGQYQIYHELLQQSTLWGYVETFRYFAIATIAVIPLVLLIKGIKRNNAENKQ